MNLTSTNNIKVGSREIGQSAPVYFIADIAANHDGDLTRAKELIFAAAEAGADAAKFQHFSANSIVSDYQFKNLNDQDSHQKNWGKSVFEVYKEASINLSWTKALKDTCEEAGIEFMTSPYSFELVDHVDSYLNAYKIGSGDITWIALIEYIAKKGKPLFIATGASRMEDVYRATEAILRYNNQLCIMQCNTNYTGSIENYRYINLNVLKTYMKNFPNCILGLSDHTPSLSTVLGAVALGAKVIEKHFTDDNNRVGPDHKFSITPLKWKEMVERTRELELSLGDGVKVVEDNEKATYVVQRRSLCATKQMSVGQVIQEGDLISLRPCPESAFEPFNANEIIGKQVKRNIQAGQSILFDDING